MPVIRGGSSAPSVTPVIITSTATTTTRRWWWWLSGREVCDERGCVCCGGGIIIFTIIIIMMILILDAPPPSCPREGRGPRRSWRSRGILVHDQRAACRWSSAPSPPRSARRAGDGGGRSAVISAVAIGAVGSHFHGHEQRSRWSDTPSDCGTGSRQAGRGPERRGVHQTCPLLCTAAAGLITVEFTHIYR